jgi:hypothetical protein
MCEYANNMRNFLTREEKIGILTAYKKNLEQEARAVDERIKDLQKNN